MSPAVLADEFHDLSSVRSRSQESLLLEMRKQLSHLYDPACLVAAIFGYPTLQ